jgi:hypothetical protein
VVFKLTGTRFGVIPFSAFSGKLQIAFGSSPNTDSFDLIASFTLGSASDRDQSPRRARDPLGMTRGIYGSSFSGFGIN